MDFELVQRSKAISESVTLQAKTKFYAKGQLIHNNSYIPNQK